MTAGYSKRSLADKLGIRRGFRISLENVVREIGLANGLVDVKVAAIDADWSGLKFVFRLEGRPR